MALICALSMGFNASATVLYGTSYSYRYSTSGDTYYFNFNTDTSYVITGDRTVYIIADDSSTTSILININPPTYVNFGGILGGVGVNSAYNLPSGSKPAYDYGSIGTVTANLYGTDTENPLTINTGSFGAVRLLIDWTSFTAEGTVTTNLTYATLNQTTTSPWTGAEVNNRTEPTSTSSTLPTATFNGVGLFLNNVETNLVYDGNGNVILHGQYFGVSIGQNPGEGNTAWASVVNLGLSKSSFDISDENGVLTSIDKAAVVVDIYESSLAEGGKNIRGVSNEGSILTVGGNIDVIIRNSSLPGVTVSGLHIDTASEIYQHMASSKDSISSSYYYSYDNGIFLSNTTVNGDINVYLYDVTQATENEYTEYTNVFGVNIGNNTAIGGQSASNNDSVAGTTVINGDINVTVNGSGNDNPLNGAFGGYISQQPQNLTNYSGYIQSEMMTTTINGAINVTVKDIYHSSTNTENNTANGIYGIYKEGSETLTVTQGITVSSIGATESVLQGVHVTAGTTTVDGTISVTAESDSTHGFSGQKSNAVEGIYAKGGTINARGGVKVLAQDFTDGALQGIYGYGTTTTDTDGKSVPTTVINTSKVEVDATNVGSTQIQGVYIDGAKLVMTGNIEMSLTNLQGSGVSGDDDQNNVSHIEGLSFNGTSDSSMSGDIVITALASSSSKFSQNIYGGVIPAAATGITFTQEGSVSVTMEGRASLMNATGSIYGTVSEISTDSIRTYVVTGNRTLNFGSSDGTAFTSSNSNSFTGAFANFDAVVVNSGSSLYIDTSQNALQGDEEVFGSTTIEADDARLNGIISASGTMKIHSAAENVGITPTLTVKQSALASITTIDNSGNIGNSGTLKSATITNSTYGSIVNYSTGTIEIEKLNMEDGSIDNKEGGIGYVIYDVQTGGQFTNAGDFGIAYQTQTNGSVLNTSTGRLGAGVVNISETGVIQSEGTMVSLDFTMEDSALVNISNGSFYVLDATYSFEASGTQYTVESGAMLNGGTMVVGSGSGTTSTAEFNPVTTEKETAPIQAKVYVNEGKLGLGEVDPEGFYGVFAGTHSVFQEAGLVENDLNITALPTNLLAITNRVQTDGNGYIGVGDASYSPVSLTALSSTENSYSQKKGLYFSGDSTLIVTNDITGTILAGPSANESVFTANTAGSYVTVDSGAFLVVWADADDMQERYYITSNYSYNDGEVWTDENIVVVNKYGQTYDYLIHSEEEDGTPVIYLAYEKQTQDDPTPHILPTDRFCDLGYVACNNIETDTDHPDDSNPGTQVVIDLTGNELLTVQERVAIMNSIANLPFAGGVIGTAMSDLNGAITDLNNHLTMDSDTFGAHGVMWPYDEFNNMWLDVHGTWYNQKHLKASGIDRVGWRANAFGFILGYDRKLKERPVALGAAFSFTGGNVKSTGNISYTKNKYKEYGVHLWGNYSPNEHLNIIGALHWMHNNSDVNQKIGITTLSGNYYAKAHGSMNTDWLAVGVRFETSLSAGAFTFVPHIEPRYVYAKMRDFDTQIDGTTIWRTHAKGNSFFQVPLGIAARADFFTESGWTIRPNFDVTITPQAGSTKLKTELRNIYNAVDAVEGEFMGKFQTAVKLGVQFDRKAWTLGAKYGLVAGDRGRIDHGFILQARLRF
ncbi:MAG: autotransporter outer membrane beta-barrel domain-containing protein [Burkholderiales bacterium]|nr:autotransporter outer membrane beta-barrel domain-containing protein [Burkholderiales bacterium]